MESEKTAKKVRALGLTSGGLDSILSALILKEQGVEVSWISFTTPFFSCDAALKAADRYQIPLMVVDITDHFLEMLRNPRAGYGKNMNPCMDCHALMFARAGEIAVEEGFDFLFSGEVAGQRPFSQNKRSLRYVEKHSGFEGSILRPLSARVLPETEAERQGVVDRSRLGAITGRSRRRQIEMAAHFNVRDYPTPAGGCKLTDRAFSTRLRDLLHFRYGLVHSGQSLVDSNKCLGGKIAGKDLFLLHHGRHFRLDPETRVVVGRSDADNGMIETFYDPEKDTLLRMNDMPGPLVLIPGVVSLAMVERAAAICAGYTKAVTGQEVSVLVLSPQGKRIVKVKVPDSSNFQDFLI
ncbi:MAG: tRNA 4-thiouridine(8) synthase ThiI [Desulfobacterium sp.]|jgi:hypothetical protein|nr:tRNA 4-thiouridine(8) synthase ThiI [Desulfobacterium sp.]